LATERVDCATNTFWALLRVGTENITLSNKRDKVERTCGLLTSVGDESRSNQMRMRYLCDKITGTVVLNAANKCCIVHITKKTHILSFCPCTFHRCIRAMRSGYRSLFPITLRSHQRTYSPQIQAASHETGEYAFVRYTSMTAASSLSSAVVAYSSCYLR
jgi:hypothetical protein